jgi:hypothetical protein
MKQGKSGGIGNSQAQPVTTSAPKKVGPRGLNPKMKEAVKGGPRGQKCGSKGG